MMPFITHTGIVAELTGDNIDTDQIIPSREMKTVSKTGLKAGLFASQRYLKGRVPNPDFVLNKPAFERATILASGKNFGCGSSREHAVWALKDYGFRAVIAESFGEIFYNNCIRNGVLPVQMTAHNISNLPHRITIDLQRQEANLIDFEISQSDKNMLLNGLDGVALTLEHREEIETWFKNDKFQRPWAYF